MKRSLFLLLWAVAGIAQTVPDHYIVELTGDPAALRASPHVHRDARLRAMEQSRTSVRQEQRRVRRAVEREASVLASVDTIANALIVRASKDKVAKLAKLAGVARIYPVVEYKLALDHALPLQHVPDAWAQIGGIDSAGAGTRIAIIDTGIDSTHPGFQDSTLAIPDGFPRVNRDSDLAYTNNKIIVARSYDYRDETGVARDKKGHGTAVAMIAAGVTSVGPFGAITGVAPKAWLGSYKVFPDSADGAPNSLILKALDDAVADGMDVVNMSLGSLIASRPGDDVLVKAVERTTAAGVIVVIASGNSGPDMATVGSPGDAPSAISVGNAYNDRVFAASARLADGAEYIAVPSVAAGGRASIAGPLADFANIDGSGKACDAPPAGSLTGHVALILRGDCTFETKLNNARAGGAIAGLVYTDADRPEASTMDTGNVTLPASMLSYADGIDLKNRLAATPELVVALRFTRSAVSVNANRIASSSSRGPNTDLSIKPDLLAVGTSIYTASLTSLGGYAVGDGTSLSAPMVSGAAALLKAARPGLTASQYRSLLVNSSAAFSLDGTNPAPVQQAGAGFLDMTAALRGTVTANPVSMSFGVGGSTLDRTQTVTVTNIGTAPDTFTLSVVPSEGAAAPVVSDGSVALQPGESRDVALRFTNEGLAPGAYQGFVQIQATQNGVAARVPYWYAISTGEPRYLTILDSAASGDPGSRQFIFFRVTDSSGVALDPGATVSAVSGGGTAISSVSVDNLVPGAFGAQVRLSADDGPNVFRIQAGSLTKDVTILAKSAAASAP